MHIAGKRLHVFQRSRRKNAVTQVEDVARAARRTPQHIVGRGKHAIERPEQHRRIEIPLDRSIAADALPRFVERRAPVRSDDIAACRA